jgi:arylsulfatase A-like enzyme
MERPPNVVLIVFDTARADAFEPYGARAGASPTVRQLAASGQQAQAYAPAPWTIPSHAAMFSGLLPNAAGSHREHQRAFSGGGNRLASLEERWLPSVFAARGYQTSAISTNALVSKTGFDMGFERFQHITGIPLCNDGGGRQAWRLVRAATSYGAPEAGQVLQEWVADASRRPFFWFINLMESHSPYLPAAPYNPLLPWDRLRAAREARRFFHPMMLWRLSCGLVEVPPEVLDRMRRLYAGAIRLMDAWLARLLESLDAHGLLDETIVVVTSDHGENLGEGGRLGHGNSLDERAIRVPFLASGPAAPVPGPLFSLVDLAGWLAVSCGIDDSPWEAPAGRNVAVAQFEAPSEAGDPRVPVVVEALGIGQPGERLLTETLSCATDGHLKLLQRGEHEELFDLDADPLEESPIPAASAPERFAADAASLRAALEQAGSDAAPRPPRPDPASRSSEEVADLVDQLRLLGYM